ncbi:MAG: adenylosuccinate lyase [Chitinivibrionia bacterium]|nr:adenylosuccinate lyase [Chitinivibrionia bacterium]
MDKIENVLAQRYAGSEIKKIWSSEGKVILEREFWIAVMKSQKELGLDIPQEAIENYEKVKENVNLQSIDSRERITKHDVKARIEEFCDLAGFEHIHKGMTSRDLTENVEQLQIFESLKIIREKTICALVKMSEKAVKYRDLIITARTHNVAAQPTTFGKRIAMFGQELLLGLENLDRIIENYAVRGIKGAVGTQLDLLTLFDGDKLKVEKLENSLAKHLGISKTMNAVGQVYPRMFDYEVVSSLYNLTAGAGSFCATLRIMAGNETASEGFAKGQVGSSAMPHKMNSRSCERINGLRVILSGYVAMLFGLSGNQWNEGDVSCSVVRRVALPDAFFATDGLFETFLSVLNQMEVFEAVIKRENEYYFPFLSTTTILMESVKKGVGRETAHEIIKENAVSAVRDLRNGKIAKNDLLERLAKSELKLSIEELTAIINRGEDLVGSAKEQVDEFAKQVEIWSKKFPKAKEYKVGSIL